MAATARGVSPRRLLAPAPVDGDNLRAANTTARGVTVRGLTLAVSALVVWAPAIATAGQYDGPPGLIAPSVTISGVDVSGLTASQARARVIQSVVRPLQRRLQLSFRGRGLSIDPRAAGLVLDVPGAVRGALAVGRTRPFVPTDVPLRRRVDRDRLAKVLALRSARLAEPAVDLAVRVRNGAPDVIPARFGYVVDQEAAVGRLARALVSRRLARYPLPVTRVAPAVVRAGSIVVVNRSTFTLSLFRGERRLRSFKVAVGQVRYPTPSGSYRIIEKQVNPTWFPPSSPWAKGLGPVPPGPGNPLGTRWMGTSAPAIGIHGTPAAYSLGSRASHGCIRMGIPDAEYVYAHVEVGTRVFIL